MRYRTPVNADLLHVFLGYFHGFGNRGCYVRALCGSYADFALFVANRYQCAKTKPPAAFYNPCNAVNMQNLLFKFFFLELGFL